MELHVLMTIIACYYSIAIVGFWWALTPAENREKLPKAENDKS